MAPSLEVQVAAYLDQIRASAVAAARVLWTQVDVDNIASSWARVRVPYLSLHEQLCVAALNATDDYMTLKAGASGVLYDVVWHNDRPMRPYRLHNGQDAEKSIGATAPFVLWWIKRGLSPEQAMLRGLNRLLRVYGTEAHAVFREVTRERVIYEMRRAA